MAVLWELSDLCHSREDNLYLYMLSKQGIVDSTGTAFWQIFSRMSCLTKISNSCVPLLEME